MEVLLYLLKPFNKNDIHTKAHRLGIKRDFYFWNKDEIDILINNYGKISIEEIQKLLPNRTYRSILKKAKVLGLQTR